jgi:hypothetical protein
MYNISCVGWYVKHTAYNKSHHICSKGLKVCGKSFIQPQVIPPFRANQITKPLVCILMGCYCRNLLFCCCSSMILIIQDNPFPEILVDLCLFIMVYMIHLQIRSKDTSLLTIRQSKDGFKN